MPTKPDDSPQRDPLTVALEAMVAPIVRSAVAEVLAEHVASDAPRPELLDRAGLARALDVAPGLVTKLKREGCPYVLVGDQPRYRLGAVLQWLEQRTRDRAARAGSQ